MESFNTLDSETLSAAFAEYREKGGVIDRALTALIQQTSFGGPIKRQF